MTVTPLRRPRPQRRRPQTPAQRFVRVWLPLLIIVSGILLALIVQTDAAYEGGALLVSAGALGLAAERHLPHRRARRP